ncbi:methanogen output domain 1-containing protein [Sphingomicrobium astaxanthinifaciens]|uniref:methanogen output domain 1-containing protein n=1 Tax=Sphingomicrobium astaxanthinifaciens TaxID=1227949 RepID=UPI001FCC4FAC|nr:methanogen output domain 1-containing protein [Sphingomicrobium astaxanthinifaciens]MCJ7420879.1 methanogen output domain 1-containing protein [Sphingomicrobium astaxanthinifaciens]
MAIQELDLPLERDLFFRQIIRALAGSLEETVGLDEASGYVALVGAEIGRWIEQCYVEAAGKTRFEPAELAEILVDLKRRIGGDFYVEEVAHDRIVLGNRRCPFGELVKGRPSLCQMTNNVFGRIAGDQVGYAKVDILKAIALGDDCCRVVIHLRPDPDAAVAGSEFFRVDG